MNYETATDFELNKALFPASRDYLKCEDVMEKKNPARSGFMWGDGSNWFEFNPCNNWNDIMPIAMELGVSIIKIKGYEALCAASIEELHDIDDDIFVARSKINISDESPQRAIVICCLEILNCKEGE